MEYKILTESSEKFIIKNRTSTSGKHQMANDASTGECPEDWGAQDWEATTASAEIGQWF